MTLPVVLRVVVYSFRFRREVLFLSFGRGGAAFGSALVGVVRATVLVFGGRSDVRALDCRFGVVVSLRSEIDSELPSDVLRCARLRRPEERRRVFFFGVTAIQCSCVSFCVSVLPREATRREAHPGALRYGYPRNV